MSDTYELKAEAREQVGKGSAREVRRNGKVPAVIYGDKQPPLAIALSYKDVYYKIHGGGFLTTVATIDVGGKKIQVLPKDFQLDPVRDFPMHVDFLRIGKDTEVNVNVPVRFINEEKSPGIKRGGVLNIVRHEVEFHCPANAIPDFITVDLTGTDIGDSIHISAVTLPKGVKPVISDRDFTIATVASSSAMKPEAAETKKCGCSRSSRRGIISTLRRPNHACLCWSRQSGREICQAPAQCRLHGGGRDCPPPWLFALEKKFQALIAEGNLGGEKIVLIKPQTFMNLSGQSVGEALRFYKLDPSALTVFYDELDLAPGKVRVKTGRRRRRPQWHPLDRRPSRQGLSPRAHRHRSPGDQGNGHPSRARRFCQGRPRMARSPA